MQPPLADVVVRVFGLSGHPRIINPPPKAMVTPGVTILLALPVTLGVTVRFMTHPLTIFRAGKSLSKAQIAALAGTSRQTIHRIERGEQTPSLKLMRRLIDATGLRADDFLPRQEDAA